MVNAVLKATAKEVGKKVLAEGLYILGTQLINASKELGRKDDETYQTAVSFEAAPEGHWSNLEVGANDIKTNGAWTHN